MDMGEDRATRCRIGRLAGAAKQCEVGDFGRGGAIIGEALLSCDHEIVVN
jgi:hypothetical protein